MALMKVIFSYGTYFFVVWLHRILHILVENSSKQWVFLIKFRVLAHWDRHCGLDGVC